MHTQTAEVVIIGGGIAGIVCALELLAQGRRVLLLDRDQPEKLGGLAPHHARHRTFSALALAATRGRASAGQFDGQGDHHTPKPYVHQAFRKYLECDIFAHGLPIRRVLC